MKQSFSIFWASALLFCIFLMHVVSLHAQTNLGQISGSVTDTTGAALAGATITVREQSKQIERTFTTDANGYFIATNLPIGTYVLTVTANGFRTAQQADVAIVADAKVTTNFTLQIGTASEVIHVSSGSVETLNSTSGEVARIIDTKQVENLALNGRNYTQLMTLVPGAVVTNPDIFAVTTSLASTNQTINGNRSDSGNLTVDGAFNQVAGSNGSLMNNVGADFIGEVKIDTSNFSAEYGRTSGPAFNIVTKSGTNAFHGGAFEYMRNNYLDARNYFATKKTKLIYNDFGFFIGGPILKDRLFFFVGEEWKRLRQQQTAQQFTVPSSALLSGNFAGQAQLNYPGTKTPIPNNDISSMITADGKAIANVYRLMSQQGLSFTDTATGNNLTLAPQNPLDFHQDLVRFDWAINQNHSIFGRWIHDQNTLTDPFGTFSNSGVLPTTPTIRSRPGQSYMVSYTWTIRPNLINQATANTSWASQHIPPTGNTWERSTYGFQYQKLYPDAGRYPDGIPYVTITGYAPFQGPNFALLSPSTDIQVGDTISWIKGNHLVKAGAIVIRDRVDQNGRPYYTGNINFNGAGSNTTGNALADALLGNFNSYQEASADPIGHFRFTQPEAFVQDTWKATHNLSLEFGVRWQLISPMYTQGNNMANFDPNVYATGTPVTVHTDGTIDPNSGNPYNGLVRTKSGIPSDQTDRVPNVSTSLYPLIPAVAPRGFYDMDGNFGPRFGFAYAARETTVIRGGFGMFFFRPEGNMTFSQVNIPPYLSNTEYDLGNLNSLGSGSAVNNHLQATISAIKPKLINPYNEQYSLGIQQQFPHSVLMELNYVGNAGRHLLRQPNINFPSLAGVGANPSYSTNFFNPYKGFGTINAWLGDSTMNYNSLQLYLAKRTGWLTFTGSYTFAKALGDSNSNNVTQENWQDRHYHYGPITNDRRQALVGTFVTQLPELRGHNMLIREVGGGWQISGVVRLQSGAYYDISGSTSATTRRADFVPGAAVYPDHKTAQAWFNKSAFTKAPNNRFGTSSVGAVVGPAFAQADLTAAKIFPIGEHVNLKFQADFFNALNRTNFSTLNVVTTNGSFGTISQANPPRQLQFGLKALF